MGMQVTLPLWAAVILTLLALWAAIDRILVPSVRWAVRRRANRAIEELNTRLKLRIQPFKLTNRAAVEGRLPRGLGVERLRDAPAEWRQQFKALGLKPG